MSNDNPIAVPYQFQYNTPNQQKLLKHNITDSKVYLSRASNNLLKAIGNDVVLSGFIIDYENIQYNNYILSIPISSGLVIQDSTLIHIQDDFTLSINTQPLDPNNGYLIIHTQYQYLNSNEENHLKIKISYISHNGQSIVPSSHVWDPNRNRILLYRFQFEKLPILKLITPSIDGVFNIFGTDYHPFGFPNFTNFSNQLYYHASDSPRYGYATRTLAGHVRIGSNLSINEGTVNIANASIHQAGAVRLSSLEETIAMDSRETAISPYNLRELILNLKDIKIEVVDPGITLGTALTIM